MLLADRAYLLATSHSAFMLALFPLPRECSLAMMFAVRHFFWG